MTLQKMKEILDAEVVVGHDQLGTEVKEGGCSDLVSEIPIYGKAGIVLLTGLTNPQVIGAAHDLGVAAIVMVRGKRPPPQTIQLSEELQMPLLVTGYILYEAVGRLYAHGLAGCMEKVGDTPNIP